LDEYLSYEEQRMLDWLKFNPAADRRQREDAYHSLARQHHRKLPRPQPLATPAPGSIAGVIYESSDVDQT
jgi:hypothetical protein